MDQKMEEYKNSEIYKRKKKTNLILLALFLLIVILVALFYLFFRKQEIKYDVNKNYYYEIESNVVYLKSKDGLETTYNCKKECSAYGKTENIELFNEGKLLLQDGDEIYLYDLLNDKKVSVSYNRVTYLYDNDVVKYLKVNDFNGNQGIIDLKGNIVVELIYKELGKTLDDKFLNYSTLDNYIVARKSEKYGLISISSGKTIIDFKYDDIKISKYNNFAVKNGEYWYFIDNKENEIFPTGYESIDIYEETLLVSLDKKAFLLDDLGNVISNKVDLYYDVNPWATITVAGLRSYEENNTIFLEIEIPTSETAGTYKKITYRYDDIVKRFVEN